MATKRVYIKGLTRCEGHCGRYLRPSNTTATDHPGTVKRHAMGRCKLCYRRLDPTPVRGQEPLVLPCTNCGHPTRPPRASITECPGTKIRVGDLCRTCDSACESVPLDRLRYLQSEVEYFNRARRARGIPEEGLKVAS